MAILAKGARVMPPRMHRAYRLEMSGRTLLTLLSLLTVTGLVVFYLGVVTGKGLRDPNPPAVATTTPGATTPAAGAAAPNNLTFNQALTSTTPQIEGLKTEQSRLAERTQSLVTQSRTELELEEVPAKSALTSAAQSAAKPTAVKSAPTAPAAAPKPTASVAAAPPAPPTVTPAAPPAVQRPAAKPAPAKPAAPAATPAASGETGYTVQVFSSMQQQNAQDLMAALKKKGFQAYLNQFQDADKKTWYRVRVGKGSKSEAEALAERLKRDGDIKSPRVMKQ